MSASPAAPAAAAVADVDRCMNLLLYGTPQSGKTALIRTVARLYGREVERRRIVPSSSSAALDAATALAGGGNNNKMAKQQSSGALAKSSSALSVLDRSASLDVVGVSRGNPDRVMDVRFLDTGSRQFQHNSLDDYQLFTRLLQGLQQDTDLNEKKQWSREGLREDRHRVDVVIYVVNAEQLQKTEVTETTVSSCLCMKRHIREERTVATAGDLVLYLKMQIQWFHEKLGIAPYVVVTHMDHSTIGKQAIVSTLSAIAPPERIHFITNVIGDDGALSLPTKDTLKTMLESMEKEVKVQQKKREEEEAKEIEVVVNAPVPNSEVAYCPHCHLEQYFDPLNMGDRLRCVCGQRFQALRCPACRKMKVWRELTYHQGDAVQCTEKGCPLTGQFFRYVKCPNPECRIPCFTEAMTPLQAAQPLVDDMECGKCGQLFCVRACKACLRHIVYQEKEFAKGAIVVCPNERCGKDIVV